MTKTAERERARELRLEGKSLLEIAQELEVSKASVSCWVRDLPQPEQFTKESRAARKAERLADLAASMRAAGVGEKKERVIGGSGRWMIPIPPGYKGKTYKQTNYIYEHRYLMEQRLGRLLRPGEVIHHGKKGPLDNSPDNLELKTNQKHSSDHALERGKRIAVFKCPQCQEEFERLARKTVNYRTYTGRLMFCSRKCSVIFHHRNPGKIESAILNLVRTYVRVE